MLLVVLKRVDDRTTELEKTLNLIKEQSKKIPEIITPPSLQPRNKDEEKEEIIEGVIGIIIDDFGYRNDEVSDGFLKLDAKMTYAVIPGHSYSSLFGRKAVEEVLKLLFTCP